MGQLRQVDAEQGRGLERRDAERAGDDHIGPEHAVPDEAREKERVGPGEKPDDSPTLAPSAVPRDQMSPPRKAGATCAMAAKDRRPMAASAASPDAR